MSPEDCVCSLQDSICVGSIKCVGDCMCVAIGIGKTIRDTPGPALLLTTLLGRKGESKGQR